MVPVNGVTQGVKNTTICINIIECNYTAGPQANGVHVRGTVELCDLDRGNLRPTTTVYGNEKNSGSGQLRLYMGMEKTVGVANYDCIWE